MPNDKDIEVDRIETGGVDAKEIRLEIARIWKETLASDQLRKDAEKTLGKELSSLDANKVPYEIGQRGAGFDVVGTILVWVASHAAWELNKMFWENWIWPQLKNKFPQLQRKK